MPAGDQQLHICRTMDRRRYPPIGGTLEFFSVDFWSEGCYMQYYRITPIWSELYGIRQILRQFLEFGRISIAEVTE